MIVHAFTMLYLALQTIFSLVSLEVAIRYFGWWWTIRNRKDINMRFIICAACVLTSGLFLNETNWVFWRIISPVDETHLMMTLLPGYIVSTIVHVVLLLGVSGMLIPLWMMTTKLTRMQMVSALIVRFLFPLTCFILGLKSAGAVSGLL